jgi:ribonuclease E
VLDNDQTNDNNDDSGAGATPADAPGTAAGSATDPGADAVADRPAKKTAAKKAAKAPAKKTAAKRTAKKATKSADPDPGAPDEAVEKPKKKSAAKKTAAKRAVAPDAVGAGDASSSEAGADQAGGDTSGASAPAAPMVLFKAPEPTSAPRKRAAKKTTTKQSDESPNEPSVDSATQESEDNRGQGKPKSGQGGNRGKGGQGGRGRQAADSSDSDEDTSSGADTDEQDSDDDTDGEGGARRRRRRGGRRRRKPSDGNGDADNGDDQSDDSDDSDESDGDGEGGGSRRRRSRRRRAGDDGDGSDDSSNTSNRARKQRNPEDEITSINGSTRLEAKKQRRRDGREAGRRRAPIVSEAEFLARRESVDRVMVIRQKDDLTQIGVLEDKVLVEHYVARESQTSLIGNVYLGRVQNVLPSMEAAFVDIGKGRNAVLYAGEVNWSGLGHKDGQQRKIESVLSPGQTILVQVSKDPVGHKGARLTGQVSLPGRFLVYVPDGNTSGISRKLPDTERNRLKALLKQIVPDTAGVIVRTAAEGASEEELTVDVERLTARWTDIEAKVKSGKGPQLLYGEPDLTLKVVRDLFTEDFAKLVVQGDDAWDLVDSYVSHVAPDLQDRLERFEPGENGKDLFTTYRVDEQIAKGLDRKVWLPSGGSLIIDRTEAMTVVDVNTGKFTGSGGNLEETVTKNNLEAAEEMVRQLRLRDIGGIIVIDFIDMVLESNRDLVLRRLVECLGRDRTRHQVAEVTSLGLVQMTRKRIGTGLLEAFSTDCEHCKGRGLIVHEHPVEPGGRSDDDEPRGRRGRGGRNRGRGSSGDDSGSQKGGNGGGVSVKPSPADLANTRRPEKTDSDENTPDEASDDKASEEKTPTEDNTTSGRAEQVEKPVIGKPPSSSHEPQAVPAESVSTDETGDSADSPAQPPPEPEAPRLVTSTRRRTARRPAGPPSPVGNTELTAGAGKKSPPSAEPVDVPVEPAGAGHTPEDEPVAERDPRADEEAATGIHADPTWPADGSPQDERSDETGDEDGDTDGDTDDDQDSANASSLLHVPIKRKGSRKR